MKTYEDTLAKLDAAIAGIDLEEDDRNDVTGMTYPELLDYIAAPTLRMGAGCPTMAHAISDDTCWRCCKEVLPSRWNPHEDGGSGICHGCRMFVLGVSDEDPRGEHYYPELVREQESPYVAQDRYGRLRTVATYDPVAEAEAIVDPDYTFELEAIRQRRQQNRFDRIDAIARDVLSSERYEALVLARYRRRAQRAGRLLASIETGPIVRQGGGVYDRLGRDPYQRRRSRVRTQVNARRQQTLL